MNENLRLSTWLRANAKHMKFEEERLEMIRAARALVKLDQEVSANLKALESAHEIMKEMRGMLEDVSKQEAVGAGPRFSMPKLWR
jgi:hypothetical protein